MNTFSRRDVLRLGAGASAAAMLGATGGCEWLFQIIKDRPVRRDVTSLAANDPILETYRAAISAMIALPSSDARNWTRQASIHNDHCPHGNWFFLPWHRAYLFYFERICRQLTGNATFALPYWNWTKSNIIPAAFWGASNSMFDANREATSSTTFLAEFVGASVVEGILEEPNFLLFGSGQASGQRDSSAYGSLEGTPHNYVHGVIGGDMGNYMSPLDPVFWAHHNMIERCWVDWNVNRQHANTNDTTWSNFVFGGNFADEHGAPVDIAVNATFLMPLLSYQYDNYALGVGAGTAHPLQKMRSRELEKFLREGAAIKLDFSRRATLAEHAELAPIGSLERGLRIPAQHLADMLPSRADERLFLIVENVESHIGDDVFVRVFVGLDHATAQTPISDPHYAGSFAFFGGGHGAHAGHRAAHQVDITRVVRGLQSAGALAAGSSATIQLVTVPIEGRKGAAKALSTGAISLGVTLDASNANSRR